MEDEIVLVAAPNHPLAQEDSVSAAAVVEAGLILREPGSATRNTAEAYFGQLGITPTAALSLGSNQALKQAAMAGGGVAVISRMGVTAETRAGMLVILPVKDWDCRRPLASDIPQGPATVAQQAGLPGVPAGGTPQPTDVKGVRNVHPSRNKLAGAGRSF